MKLDSQIKKTYSDGYVVVMRDKYFECEAIEKCQRLNDNDQGIHYEVVAIQEGDDNE